MRKNIRDLTQGNVNKQFITTAIPVVFGMLSIMFFGVVDTYFISLIGIEPLAAMAFAFPIIIIFISVFLGLGNAVFTFISPSIGAKKYKQAFIYSSQGTIIVAIIIGIILLTTFLCQPYLYKLLKITPKITAYTYDYMNIWFITGFFTAIQITWEKSMHGIGNTKLPAISLIIGAILNIILDPLLIFGIWIFPELGVQGASLATLIGTLVSIIIMLVYMVKSNLLGFNKKVFHNIWSTSKKIIMVCLPSTYFSVMLSALIVFMNILVINYGEDYLAGVGTGLRFERIFVSLLIGILVACSAIIGQNLGIRNKKRIMNALNLAIIYFIGISIAVLFVVIIFGKDIIGLFTDNQVAIKSGYTFLTLNAIGFTGHALIYNTISVLILMQKIKLSYIVITIQVIITAISMLVLQSMLGFIGIFIGFITAKTIVGIIGFKLLKKEIKNF